MVTGDKGHDVFTQVRALLIEVKPYSCLINIDDRFPEEQLAVVNASRTAPWYADYANYIVAKFILPSFTYQQKKKFFCDLRHYFWDDPHLYKEG